MHVQSLQFSLDENQWQQDWAILVSLASQPGTNLRLEHTQKVVKEQQDDTQIPNSESLEVIQNKTIEEKNSEQSTIFQTCNFHTNSRS